MIHMMSFSRRGHNERRIDRIMSKVITLSAYTADDSRCTFCRCRILRRDLTIDHIIPKIRGGSNHRDNLQHSCRPCNYAKGSMLDKDFRRIIQGREVPDSTSIHIINVWIRRRLEMRTVQSLRRLRKRFNIPE